MKIKYILLFYLFLISHVLFSCVSKNIHKDKEFELHLYYNPVSAFMNNSIDQILQGAYEQTISRTISEEDIKNILGSLEPAENFYLKNSNILYSEFIQSYNAKSVGIVRDKNGKEILIFTFDELKDHSEYMLINGGLYKKNEIIYQYINDDINNFLLNHEEKKKQIKDNSILFEEN